MSFSSDLAQTYNLLPISIDFPADQDIFLNELTLLYKRIANAVNSKEAGLYELKEVATGQRFFIDGDPLNYRNIYRMTVDFGALPNADTKTIAHGIAFSDTFQATRIYGAATDPVNHLYLPLPFATPAALNENISLSLDGTMINVTTGINYSAYTETVIVIEYAKQM